MRYALMIQYDGTNFSGWQTQKDLPSVQSTLERALSELFQTKTTATASGRTDAGTHAAAQIVHFDADTSIPAEKIPFALNSTLPSDLVALKCAIVQDDFHARFQAINKTYTYRLYFSAHRRPLLDHDRVHAAYNVDVNKMKKAAKHLVGKHDFSAFMATGSMVSSTVRTIFGIEIKDYETMNSHCIDISVKGDGFLYNMARIIAGTLLYVGVGKLSQDDIPNIITSRDRTKAGKTLAAKGLTLEKVEYAKNIDWNNLS